MVLVLGLGLGQELTPQHLDLRTPPAVLRTCTRYTLPVPFLWRILTHTDNNLNIPVTQHNDGHFLVM